MTLASNLAKHFRDLHFGGNWTASNLKDQLSGMTWKEATTKVGSLNTIVALVYHINYYVVAMMKVLNGGPLDSKDKYSFDHPPVNSQEDWEKLIEKTLSDAETFSSMIEQLPDARLWEDFTDGKYGSYFRNIQGIIEHSHYHLGQIVVIRKMAAGLSTLN